MDMHEWRAAASAARALGFSVRRFTREEMTSGAIALGKDTPVIGSRSSLLHALRCLAVVGATEPLPERDDYPACLRTYMGRRIWGDILANVLDAAAFEQPIFVKPRGAANTKRFTSLVLRDDGNAWLNESCLPPTMPVWCSDVLDLQTEWRCYVLRGKAKSVCYSGDALEAPLDQPKVFAMVAALQASGEGAAAYALDVGVARMADGSQQTVLLEVNDGYALGLYPGCPEQWYVAMMVVRWQELVEEGVPSVAAAAAAAS
jgi:hypothetical protein